MTMIHATDCGIPNFLAISLFTLTASAFSSSNKFSKPYDLGEPLYITDIYNVINDTPGVVDVVSVKISNKSGGDYSEAAYSIDDNLSPDGRMLVTPEDAVIELKYPNKDIKGTIR